MRWGARGGQAAAGSGRSRSERYEACLCAVAEEGEGVEERVRPCEEIQRWVSTERRVVVSQWLSTPADESLFAGPSAHSPTAHRIRLPRRLPHLLVDRFKKVFGGQGQRCPSHSAFPFQLACSSLSPYTAAAAAFTPSLSPSDIRKARSVVVAVQKKEKVKEEVTSIRSSAGSSASRDGKRGSSGC